ncbi:hypothetical protein ACFUMJ_32820, partial [Streptomyces olivaceus]|uniref:hypothetical protein n=1 Tax=Streptomyces olivaceus TaxID=47716 RepID=UPI00363EBA35
RRSRSSANVAVGRGGRTGAPGLGAVGAARSRAEPRALHLLAGRPEWFAACSGLLTPPARPAGG